MSYTLIVECKEAMFLSLFEESNHWLRAMYFVLALLQLWLLMIA